MSQQPFGDIPLFREIERILAASEGPVNFEIARQVAVATATQGLADPTPSPEAARVYSETVQLADEYLAGYTRLQADEPSRSSILGRGEWVTSTLGSWRWLLERLARRFGDLLAAESPEEPSQAAGGQMQSMLGNIGPLLMGIQVGTMVGRLATTTLARYDLPIPREDEGNLFFIDQNAQTVANDYQLDADSLRRWLALQHSARHLVARSVPWLLRYLRNLLLEIVDSIEIDMGGIERRIAELQTRGPEALQGSLGAEDLIPIVDTERRRKADDRLLAFVALWEGYARHAAAQVGATIVDDDARISESMARRALDPNEGEAMMTGVLGLTIDRALQGAGQTFCAAVARLHGPTTLNRVWEAPDNLPTLQEIRDPFAWMERVAAGEALEEGSGPGDA